MSDYKRMTRHKLIERLSALESKDTAVREALRTVLAQAALRDSEERLRAILHTAVEGIITIDERGTVESFNLAAEKLFGYKAREVIGNNVSMLMPSPYRQEHDSYIGNYRRTGKAKIIGIGREVVGQRKDGSVFPMDLSVGEMRIAGGRMFTGIVRDITERKRLEKLILETADGEQRRIGQDLHDDLGQRLTGIELMSEVLEQKLAGKSLPESAIAAEIARHVREAISQTRSLARGLSPVVTGSEGLMSALEELARRTKKMSGISCQFYCPRPVPVRDHSVAGHLYRIGQEAVSNAVRHGKAKEIQIRLARSNGQLTLSVKDNGRGIQSTPAKRKGMGLQIMNHRAGIIGGALRLEAPAGKGTCVVCTIDAKTSGKGSRR